MKSKSLVLVALILLLAAVAYFTVACSSSTSTPTSPVAQGKGLVRGQVLDGDSNPVPGAVILVDDEPMATTDDNGEFSIDLEPGTYRIAAQAEGKTLWSLVLTIEEGEEKDVTDPEGAEDNGAVGDGGNGIGQCVSECTHTYNPSKRDPEADPLFSGKFNARYCVDFCRGTSYRGGASKGPDGNCNEFYKQSDPDCGPWPNGDPCKVDDVCASGNCEEGFCEDIPLLENGEACGAEEDCASGVCEGGICGLPTGDPCTDNEDCGSLLCEAGACL